MKSGGPWNLRGLRPQTHEAASDAARRAGMSVGEWLDDLIQQNNNHNGGLMRNAACEEETDGNVAKPNEPLQLGDQETSRQRPQRHGREYDRENTLAREASLAREEFDDVHSRLDRLTYQLERMARSSDPLRNASPQPQYLGAEQDALVERQRALFGAPASASSPVRAGLPIDLASLEQQLRQHITNQIESLQPQRDVAELIAAFRGDLFEIGRQMTEALPQQAVESLNRHVEALAERVKQTRQSGVDPNVLAAIERGLAEVRDALRSLTTAESLVGFDESIKALAQKVDLIIARQDPATLERLETAIGALRGVVSHVASNDALDKVARDVRAFAAKVDAVAGSAASGRAISALESRIDALASAVQASAEVGHAVPSELEKLLSVLIEKLDGARLTQTDRAVLRRLEEVIPQFIKRLDASDVRLDNLEAIERGLADLLVHINRSRGESGGDASGAGSEPAAVAAIARDVAEIKSGEQRTQDSLEAIHSVVEQLVDKLAMIERDVRDATTRSESPNRLSGHSANEPAAKSAAGPAALGGPRPIPTNVSASPALWDFAAARSDTRRAPIDPKLPPDHPLEPGSAVGTRSPSAAEPLGASEPAIGAAEPATPGETSDKQDFIAAARRAVQAAVAPVEREVKSESRRRRSSRTRAEKQEKQRRPSSVRKLFIAGPVMLLTVGCLEIALHMYQDSRPAAETPAMSAGPSPPAALSEVRSSLAPAPTAPMTPTVPAAPLNAVPATPSANAGAPTVPTPDTAPPAALPQASSSAPESAPTPAPIAAPASASALSPALSPTLAPAVTAPGSTTQGPADITGSLTSHTALPSPATSMPAPPPPPPSESDSPKSPEPIVDKLPVTIGGPTLRTAAIAGDTAAEFEVAMRYAQGRGVPQDQQQAAHWLELAAQQGLALAQFRLGGFYEKGIGVKKDLSQARKLYLAAAAKGNAKAMHNLAVLYAEGTNGPGDYRAAALWFRKAAEHGIIDSQYNLAILCERGSGEPQSYAEAYKWFAIAADQGDSEAAAKRDEIASRLDEETLQATDLAVKNWKPEPQPDDAVNIKTPPGGWDAPERVAKVKVPLPIARPATAESTIK